MPDKKIKVTDFLVSDEEQEEKAMPNILEPKTMAAQMRESIDIDKIQLGQAESKVKDIWDAWNLASNQVGHNVQQYFSYTLPATLYSKFAELHPPLEEYKAKEKEIKDTVATWKKNYDEKEQKFQSWLSSHQELQPRSEWTQGVVETFKNSPQTASDPAYWAYIIAEAAPFTAATIGTTMIVATATGNPLAGLAASFGMASAVETKNIYQELLNAGAPEEQARDLSIPVGLTVGAIEVVSDLPLLKSISKPFYNVAKKTIVSELSKGVSKSIIARGAKKFAAIEIAEIIEENLQDAVTNAAVKIYDEGRDIMPDVAEVSAQTAMATLPWAFLGVGGEVAKVRAEGRGQTITAPEVPIEPETPAIATPAPTVEKIETGKPFGGMVYGGIPTEEGVRVTEYGEAPHGHWTTTRSLAEAYAGEGGEVRERYLEINNPYVTQEGGDKYLTGVAQRARNKAEKAGGDMVAQEEAAKAAIPKALQRKGYDALVVETEEGIEVIPYKSAPVSSVLGRQAKAVETQLEEQPEANIPIGKLKKKQIKALGVRETVDKIGKADISNLPLKFKQRIQDVLKDFDVAFRTKKTLRRRQALKDYITRLEQEGVEPKIPQHYLDMAFKTPLNEMTTSQLKQIADLVEGLAKMGSLKNRLLKVRARRNVDETEKVIVDVLGMPEATDQVVSEELYKENWWINKLRRYKGFLAGSYRVERILKALDDYEENGIMWQTFYGSVNEATDVKFRAVQEEMGKLTDYIKTNRIRVDQLLKLGDPISTGQRFTPTERIGVFLHSKSKDNMAHLVYGNKLSVEMIKEIINQMSPNEIAMAEFLEGYFRESAQAISDTRTEVEGKPLDVVEGYFPILIDPRAVTSFKSQERKLIEDSVQDLSAELNLEDSFRFAARSAMSGVSKAFTRARTHRAIQPIQLDALRIYVHRMEATEHYKAFAPVIRDLQLLLNREGVQKAIVNKSSRAWLDEIKTWTQDVAKTNPLAATTREERLMRRLRVNATAAVLGLNLTTMLKQIPSFMIGAVEVGNMPALKGIYTFLNHPLETRNMIKELAPQIYNRTIERELAEAKVLRSIEQRATNKMSLRETFMLLTVTADRIVVSSLWRGAFDDYISKNPGELQAAADYASAAIRKTQPFFTVKDVPRYWRSNEFMKTLTMFTNQLNQYWNYYRFDIFGAAAAGKVGSGKVAKAIIEGFVIPAIMIGWISRSEPPEDWKDIGTDLSAMALATFPIVGNFMVSGLRGFYSDSGLITTEVFDRIQRLTYTMANEQWDKAALVIPELAGYAVGVPVAQPRRMAEAIYNLASGKSDDWLELIWGSWTREQARKDEEKSTPSFTPGKSRFKIQDLMK